MSKFSRIFFLFFLLLWPKPVYFKIGIILPNKQTRAQHNVPLFIASIGHWDFLSRSAVAVNESTDISMNFKQNVSRLFFQWQQHTTGNIERKRNGKRMRNIYYENDMGGQQHQRMMTDRKGRYTANKCIGEFIFRRRTTTTKHEIFLLFSTTNEVNRLFSMYFSLLWKCGSKSSDTGTRYPIVMCCYNQRQSTLYYHKKQWFAFTSTHMQRLWRFITERFWYHRAHTHTKKQHYEQISHHFTW